MCFCFSQKAHGRVDERHDDEKARHLSSELAVLPSLSLLDQKSVLETLERFDADAVEVRKVLALLRPKLRQAHLGRELDVALASRQQSGRVGRARVDDDRVDFVVLVGLDGPRVGASQSVRRLDLDGKGAGDRVGHGFAETRGGALLAAGRV